MSCLEDDFHNTEASFHRRSNPADSLVSQFIKNAKLMPSCCSFHRCIVSLGFCTMIPLVAISDLSFICQIHLAVMDVSNGRLNIPDEIILSIDFNVSLVAEIGFVPFL